MTHSTQRLQMGRAVLVTSFLAVAAAGCGTSSQLVDQWRDPSFDRPMSHVLVLGMMRNPVQRRTWEDRFAEELQRKGVDAEPSYRQFPDAMPDTDQVADAVRAGNFDGVVVTMRLPSQTRRNVVPGYVETVPVTRYSRWRSAYTTYWRDVYRPGYVETERVVRFRTDVWSADQDGAMIWSATSEIFDPSSRDAVNHEIAKRIVPELAKEGIIRG